MITRCILAAVAALAALPEGECSGPCGAESASGCGCRKNAPAVLELELLALDLSTCDRCTGTDSAVEATLAELRPILATTGVSLRFRKTVVETAEQAVRVRLVSSPTLRINGLDLPVEYRESHCGDCGELCSREASIDCRAWVWQGREYAAAPKGLLLDAILRAYPRAFEKPAEATGAFDLPENLRRFFAAKSNPSAELAQPKPCCDTRVCCAPSEKAACCGTTTIAKDKAGCVCKPR